MGTMGTIDGRTKIRVVDCGTPRTCENVKKCSTWFHLLLGSLENLLQGVFWFRQRSTFLPEIVETVEYVHHPQMDEFFHVLWQTHKAIFTTWWCFMLRFTRELSHITYVLSIIYTVYIYIHIYTYIYKYITYWFKNPLFTTLPACCLATESLWSRSTLLALHRSLLS